MSAIPGRIAVSLMMIMVIVHLVMNILMNMVMFMVMVNFVIYGDDDIGDDYHDVYDNDVAGRQGPLEF